MEPLSDAYVGTGRLIILSVCMSHSKSAIALALLSLSTTFQIASAQEAVNLSTVMVYGAGFGEPLSQALPQTQVISSAQIHQSGLNTVGDILEKLGHLHMQQDLGVNMNASPDIRGYGATASNNTVILVDGVKISQNEQAPARIWSLPVEAIDHIEIIRGSTTVLYGEGATSGAINIITNKQKEDIAIASVGVGSYGTRNASAYASKGLESGRLGVYGKSSNSNGYRQQSDSRLRSGGIQYDHVISSQTAFGFRFGENKDKANLPGFLTLSKWSQNPTLPQYALSDLYQNTAVNTTVTNQIGSVYAKHESGDWSWVIDFSRRDASTDFMDTRDPTWDMSSVYQYHSRQDALNAKAKVSNAWFSNNTVIWGFTSARSFRDLNQWGLPESMGQYSTGYTSFNNLAWFMQDDWRITGVDRLTLGVRREQFAQDATASVMQYPPTTYAHQSGKQLLNAYELQYSRKLNQQITSYVKTGQSYRLPNVDDLNRFCAATCIQSLVLQPQINKDFEIGAAYQTPTNRGHLKFYRTMITNEILFDKYADGQLGYNINIPKTQRDGIEFFNDYNYGKSLRFHGSLNINNARFSTPEIESATGINGKRIPGTPEYVLGLGLNFSLNNSNAVSWTTRLMGHQYPQGDAKNEFELGSYAVSDLGYRWTHEQWTLLANLNNVFDRKYGVGVLASNTSPNYPYGVYPNWGRNFLMTMRYSFQ